MGKRLSSADCALATNNTIMSKPVLNYFVCFRGKLELGVMMIVMMRRRWWRVMMRLCVHFLGQSEEGSA